MALNAFSASGATSFRVYGKIGKAVQNFMHGHHATRTMRFLQKATKPIIDNFGFYSPLRVGSQGRAAFRMGGTRGRWYKDVAKTYGDDFANEMLNASKYIKGSGSKFKLMSNIASGTDDAARYASATEYFNKYGGGNKLLEQIKGLNNKSPIQMAAKAEYANKLKAFRSSVGMDEMGRVSKGVSKISRTPWALKGPGGMAMATLGMTMEMEAEGLRGLLTGPAREVAGTIGATIGMQIGSIFGPIATMIGAIGGGMLGYNSIDLFREASEKGRAWSTPDMGGRFRDSIGAQTMRQRSLNAIRTSQFNIRSEMGNEAVRIATGGF